VRSAFRNFGRILAMFLWMICGRYWKVKDLHWITQGVVITFFAHSPAIRCSESLYPSLDPSSQFMYAKRSLQLMR